jgi:hypothetical protein
MAPISHFLFPISRSWLRVYFVMPARDSQVEDPHVPKTDPQVQAIFDDGVSDSTPPPSIYGPRVVQEHEHEPEVIRRGAWRRDAEAEAETEAEAARGRRGGRDAAAAASPEEVRQLQLAEKGVDSVAKEEAEMEKILKQRPQLAKDIAAGGTANFLCPHCCKITHSVLGATARKWRLNGCGSGQCKKVSIELVKEREARQAAEAVEAAKEVDRRAEELLAKNLHTRKEVRRPTALRQQPPPPPPAHASAAATTAVGEVEFQIVGVSSGDRVTPEELDAEDAAEAEEADETEALAADGEVQPGHPCAHRTFTPSAGN